MTLLRRALFVLATVLLALVVAGIAFAGWSVRRPFPDPHGVERIEGLNDRVDIHRDDWGVPHITGSTPEDLFLAQGYVHAQDRFWQMDVRRHIGAGRLSALFGSSQLDTDRFIRTLGWRRVAEREWDLLDDDSRRMLEAYAEGVNAYIADRSRTSLSVGHLVVGLQNRSAAIPPWTPLDSLTWLKVMAWDLRSNLEAEIERALLLDELGEQRMEELFPPYPDRHPRIVASGGVENGDFVAEELGVEAASHAIDELAVVAERLASLEAITGPPGGGTGSNSWVVSGERTATGAPLLVNDPHLAPSLPSIWYEVGLHCRPLGASCPYDVRGFSFAGLPGVVIGHNHRIAWGFTNLGADVTDLYVERLDPEGDDRYEVDGELVPLEIVEGVIEVAGDEPVTQRVRLTRHGPILSDESDEVAAAGRAAGVTDGHEYAVALRWTALDPTPTLDAIFALNRASDWDEFREAARLFDVPAQNLVYADVDGHIGYQMPGRIPLRPNHDGRLPVPGWTSEFEWEGEIPYDELPRVFDPPEGIIVTANNAAVPPGYRYHITDDWNHGWRAQRIVELLDGARELSAEDMNELQFDAGNLLVRHLGPHLEDVDADGAAATVRDEILAWDGQQSVDSSGAAAFNVFWSNLLARTFHDELPEGLRPAGTGRWWEVVRGLLDEPRSHWWDDTSTAEQEERDSILSAALADAAEELVERAGDDPHGWRWGSLHGLVLREQTLGLSGIGPLERIFNRGPFATPGGQEAVNATAWYADGGYEVTWVPSMRMVVDLDGFAASTSVNLTGQSGHPFHDHYTDQVDLWARGGTKPMRFTKDDIEDAAVNTLRLVP